MKEKRMNKETFQKKLEETEEIVKKYLPQETGFQKTVIEAMNYSVLAGGKRLRPMLMGEVYALFEGQDRDRIEPFMAAIEMIHTYSLVHDDLPAMDNDDYRRGKLTTHKAFGEAMGILAGDALLNYAFETAVKAFKGNIGDCQVGKALQILAEKAGIYGMIGGQTVDVEMSGKKVKKEILDFIYQLKTGALITASMQIGAVLAGAREEEWDLICKVASDVGLAFQIQDDILDVTGTAEVLGKPIHSDEKNEKTTYVTLVGLEQAKRDVEEISLRAVSNLSSIKGENQFLKDLIYMLINRKK
jgi:geranylgeranyl diphosphate synthase type II